MDVSAKMLHDVEFRERFRGYDPDEVDDFLERVAKAVEQLQARLREATDRADAADARAAQGSDIDEALRRTLVLAQRTADQVVAEADEQARVKLQKAEDEAALTVARANERSGRVVADAEVRAAAMIAEADRRAAVTLADADSQAATKLATAQQEANVRFGSTQERLTRDVEALEERRTALKYDVDRLEQFIDQRREGIRRSIERLQVILDDPDHLDDDGLPALRSPEPINLIGAGPQPAPAAVVDVSSQPAFSEPASGQPIASQTTPAQHWAAVFPAAAPTVALAPEQAAAPSGGHVSDAEIVPEPFAPDRASASDIEIDAHAGDENGENDAADDDRRGLFRRRT
jgi:cell division initiation protein